MVRALFLIVLVATLLLGATIGYFNAQPVQFDYLFGTAQWPLVALLLAIFIVGVVVAMAFAGMRILRLRVEVARLRKQLRERDAELKRLRAIPAPSPEKTGT